MDSSPAHRAPQPLPLADLSLGAAALAGLLLITTRIATVSSPTTILAVALYAGFALTVVAGLGLSGCRFGPADRVTLVRAVLVLFLASLAGTPVLLQTLAWPYALLCLLALIMDGADGYVARRTGTASPFGASFDMELDAFFILVLCVALMVLGKAGPWVLVIGLMRYGFVMAGMLWTWLNEPLPESFRRKTICVWQLITLMVALLPPVPDWFAHATLIMALVLLAASFALDIRYLYRHSTTRS
ncbi:CDP-alcohol phosphatidyltransferase family protein [Marinobacter segnicrescens]|uniref:CDP-alcohol phosphatidyltransferase family protein n=1 Tax=Marinobacter segnicrescens TaxID=430453 RepID=UPI003A8F16DB